MTDESQSIELSEDEKKIIEDMISEEGSEGTAIQRREFIRQILMAGGGVLALQLLGEPGLAIPSTEAIADVPPASIENSVSLSLRVNGLERSLAVDSRMTLLDTLRERLQLTGSKKGCDHGQCGACTVIIDGRRMLSCLTLAASCEGRAVTTIEGLAKAGRLNPVQAAFLKHDGFQCGYCTPGQICSAVALMKEAEDGEASYVTSAIRTRTRPFPLSDEEIRERMSGNICRCGAYANIVSAIREVHTGKDVAQSWRFIDEASGHQNT